MLFGYPLEATAENWLHECVCEMLRIIQRSHSRNEEPPGWPEIIPAAHRDALNRRPGLRDRILAYRDADAALTQIERDAVALALEQQNDIEALLSCTSDCAALEDIPEAVRIPVRSLFEFAFDLLSDLEIRDRQYEIIYNYLKYHICPFCGYEYLAAPESPREALDHYLTESRYPFAGVNLRNLAPMGHACNSKYKLTMDILRRRDGTRRRAFNPYNAPGVTVSLNGSILDGPRVTEWRIGLADAGEEIETWDDVFSIRTRYVRDILDPCFTDWLWEFRNWCQIMGSFDTAEVEVIEAVSRYVGYLEEFGFKDRYFLRAAVFRMLLHNCHAGNQRVLQFMVDVVKSAAQ